MNGGFSFRQRGAALVPGGRLVLSFPNRWAYWPWYHLNPLRKLIPAAFRRGRQTNFRHRAKRNRRGTV